MSNSIVVSSISIPERTHSSTEPQVDVSFMLDRYRCPEIANHFESIDDLKRFFDEIAVYASYRVKQEISKKKEQTK